MTDNDSPIIEQIQEPLLNISQRSPDMIEITFSQSRKDSVVVQYWVVWFDEGLVHNVELRVNDSDLCYFDTYGSVTLLSDIEKDVRTRTTYETHHG